MLSCESLLSRNPTDEEILSAVEAWIDALAQGDYARAYELTEHDSYYGWSPELIHSVIEGYGLPALHLDGERFSVTPRELALEGPPRRAVDRAHIRSPVVAEVRYDLPLNGVWSDLTATFRIESRETASAIVLQEIHVF